MKIIIDRQIRCWDIPVATRTAITDELTILNPQYEKSAVMKIPLWNIPKYIRLYEYEGSTLVIPRGYLHRILKLTANTKVEITDRRKKLEKVVFQSDIKLRSYQSPAVDAAIRGEQGVVIMPCGSGKTETGDQIVAEIGQPTLWITHTKDLLNQSLERAKAKLKLMPDEYGVIAGNEFSTGSHMTFGMVQTLANRNLSGVADKFGCVVVDECHKVFKDHKAVRQFYSVISQLPARYRIGLTASEHRSDGLIETMFLTIGPKLYEVTQDNLTKTGYVVTPAVYFIPTQFTFDGGNTEW